MYRDSSSSKLSRGITLIETLVALTILVIGIVGVMGGLGALARAESRLKAVETMTSLAQHKYEELIAITPTLDTSQTGDFRDQNITDYTWSADVEQTGVTNLIALTVTVTPANDQSASAPNGHVSGLLYTAPASTTTTTTTTSTNAAGGARAGG